MSMLSERGIGQTLPLDHSPTYVSGLNSRVCATLSALTRLAYRDKDDDHDGDDDDQDEQYAIDTPKAVRPNFSHHRQVSHSDSVPESDDTETTTSAASSSSEEMSASSSDVMTITAPPRDWTWTYSDYWLDLHQPSNPSESPFDDESDDDDDGDGDNSQELPRGIDPNPQSTRGRIRTGTALPPGMRTADHLRQYDTFSNDDPDVGEYDDNVLASYWNE